ncbi:regulatory LuxR family protein [Kribbella sp. VKM Ac-2571]|uniref:helix-turn-helix transcriptional regulator n=1 Tax=Kribbella sp. VKM Ac-2571 TaxID=2512222 RepID=UPI00105FE551|nr:LuxR family transcriptional regulator [Kribbella sp. VKM Ac-2571]TDO57320.1 regulatory LuxR family protein [Kribbella sp. VKM Ac-2571]
MYHSEPTEGASYLRAARYPRAVKSAPQIRTTGLRLAHLGVDATAERTYLVVLERPSWTPAELGERLGLDDAATHDVIQHLTGLGLLSRAGSGEVVRPLNPRLSLTALLAEREADLARVTRDLERSRVAAAEIAGEFARRHPAPLGDGNSALDWAGSPAAAQRTIEGLLKSAAGEVLVSTPATTALSDPIAGLRELGTGVLAPPVRYRILVPDAARTDPMLARRLQQLTRNGAQVRTATTVPLCAMIVDSATVALPADRTGRGAVSILRLASAVGAVTELYERIWHAATPLRQPTGLGDASGLTVREREVLSLLGDGGTDASAAAQLGVSVRTVRRMVSEMMARLGAQSRFQAGLKAAERGWVGTR